MFLFYHNILEWYPLYPNSLQVTKISKLSTSLGWWRDSLSTCGSHDSPGARGMLWKVAPNNDCTSTFKPSIQFDNEKYDAITCIHDFYINVKNRSLLCINDKHKMQVYHIYRRIQLVSRGLHLCHVIGLIPWPQISISLTKLFSLEFFKQIKLLRCKEKRKSLIQLQAQGTMDKTASCPRKYAWKESIPL